MFDVRYSTRLNPDIKTLKPGMTVYLLPCGAEDKRPVKEGEIVKVGRRYVSVKEKTGIAFFPVLIQFDATNGFLEKLGKYGRSFELFFSLKEIDDYFLHRELVGKVNNMSNYAYYLNNHQLKQICDLLEKGKRIHRNEQ